MDIESLEAVIEPKSVAEIPEVKRGGSGVSQFCVHYKFQLSKKKLKVQVFSRSKVHMVQGDFNEDIIDGLEIK